MQVTVNGNPHTIDSQTTIRQLLRLANVPDNYLAIEVNQEVIPRSQHEVATLQPGDEVEVVTLVGGG
jgi:sulfur carrier protein